MFYAGGYLYISFFINHIMVDKNTLKIRIKFQGFGPITPIYDINHMLIVDFSFKLQVCLF
jgi:hypothetical protein